MDRAVIDRKFETIRKCLSRIVSKTPKSLDDLQSDLDAQDIIVLNLERAVQASVDIASHIIAQENVAVPETLSGCFAALKKIGVLSDNTAMRMQKAVGFRNIAVQEYEVVDWAIVFTIITKHLEDFRRFAKEVNSWLEKT